MRDHFIVALDLVIFLGWMRPWQFLGQLLRQHKNQVMLYFYVFSAIPFFSVLISSAIYHIPRYPEWNDTTVLDTPKLCWWNINISHLSTGLNNSFWARAKQWLDKLASISFLFTCMIIYFHYLVSFFTLTSIFEEAIKLKPAFLNSEQGRLTLMGT